MDKAFPEFKFKGVPLTNEQSQQFLSLCLSKQKEIRLDQTEPNLRNQFSVQILLKRIEVYKLPFIVSDFFFIMSLITFVNSPGRTMLLLRLCYQYYKKTQKTFLGIDDWAMIFPFGTPTEKELEEMWDSQKLWGKNPDNMVDYIEYWK